MSTPPPSSRRQVFGWALYDWGNSAFATTVMAGFFPAFYGRYWRPLPEGMDAQSTFELGIGNAVASLMVAVMAPILGSIADRGSAKKRFLACFTALGVGMTAALFLVPQGGWFAALAVYGLGVVGFSGANVFYDSLLVSVAPPDKSDFVSGLGYSLGYLGGGVLLALNLWMVRSPATFGIPDATTAVRVAFLTVAVWWALFAIPIMVFVREPAAKAGRVGMVTAAVQGWRQLATTFREIRRLRTIWLFLLAYWLYIDGVQTVIKMAVKFGQSLGFDDGTLIGALLLTQAVGFPAALLYGWFGHRIGTRRAILIGIVAYGITTIASVFMTVPAHFFALAVAVGLVQGGVQALSRSYFGRLIPADKAGEFFGFYNMLGKFATILGPTLMGVSAWALGSTRLSILSLLLLFGAGGWLLSRVREAELAPQRG